MARYFEFWCRTCGHHYYHSTPEMKTCIDVSCGNANLEFAAIVDSNDGVDGPLGSAEIITQRYPLDTKATN